MAFLALEKKDASYFYSTKALGCFLLILHISMLVVHRNLIYPWSEQTQVFFDIPREDQKPTEKKGTLAQDQCQNICICMTPWCLGLWTVTAAWLQKAKMHFFVWFKEKFWISYLYGNLWRQVGGWGLELLGGENFFTQIQGHKTKDLWDVSVKFNHLIRWLRPEKNGNEFYIGKIPLIFFLDNKNR